MIMKKCILSLSRRQGSMTETSSVHQRANTERHLHSGSYLQAMWSSIQLNLHVWTVKANWNTRRNLQREHVEFFGEGIGGWNQMTVFLPAR